MWLKVLETGLSCKMLTMLKSIHDDIQSCAKLSHRVSQSELFNVSLGLQQSEPIALLSIISDIVDKQNVR